MPSASNVVGARPPPPPSTATSALTRAMDSGVNQNDLCRSGSAPARVGEPPLSPPSICANSWCGKATCGERHTPRTS
uniref:Uncharacterized protein n=1 Tax=Oryza rufipogon TaxID=4529 RepID=A0A0E0NDJ3_ORYRU